MKPQLTSDGASEIKYFRTRKLGPEALLEATVARSLETVVSPSVFPRWVGASMPIGAGMPDLLVISWAPEVIALAQRRMSDASILAYLRVVGCARMETIVKRLGRHIDVLSESLDGLVRVDVLRRDAGKFSLAPNWRTILPDVTAIEAKISNWQRAIAQAARNQLFSHRSFVALPERVAVRASESEIAARLGIGVIAVSEAGDLQILRDAMAKRPKIWSYYYQIAHQVALDLSANRHAIPRSNRTSTS